MMKYKNLDHNNYNTSLYKYIRAHGDVSSWYPDKIEIHLNITNNEILTIKRKRIDNTTNCINVYRPITSLKEDEVTIIACRKRWVEDNKEQREEQLKSYRIENKRTIKEKE